MKTSHFILQQFVQTKSYFFDARKGKGVGGSFIRSFTQDNCTDGFTTITIILSRSKKYYSLLQLIFIQKTKISSFWDFNTWFQPLLQSNALKFQTGKSSSIYIGENLAKYLSPSPGHEKKTGRRLVDILDIDEDKIYHDVNLNQVSSSMMPMSFTKINFLLFL